MTFWSWITSLVTALGNFTLMPDWNVNDEVSIKKIRSKKRQSIIGAISICRNPCSSLLCLLNFMSGNLLDCLLESAGFGHVTHKIDQLGRVPFHLKGKSTDAAHAIVIRHERRDGHHQAGHRGDQGFSYPSGQIP